ncbi:MAG: hypothetical protein IJU02_07345 [Lachnospiraceae bacterium]|nr:hypothetical protein [Lachnospiraceae bacterium]
MWKKTNLALAGLVLFCLGCVCDSIWITSTTTIGKKYVETYEKLQLADSANDFKRELVDQYDNYYGISILLTHTINEPTCLQSKYLKEMDSISVKIDSLFNTQL